MGGGGGGKKRKKLCKGKCPKKKFMQGKMSEKKIHAQDGPHFDMKSSFVPPKCSSSVSIV